MFAYIDLLNILYLDRPQTSLQCVPYKQPGSVGVYQSFEGVNGFFFIFHLD